MKSKAAIETTSRLKVWYLSTFGNCTLKRAYAKPVLGPLGRISYERRWIFEANLDLPGKHAVSDSLLRDLAGRRYGLLE